MKTKNEIIIEQFKDIHEDKYDYSKMVYKRANEKVIIICKKHGEFSQTPNSHKRGIGCAKCAGRNLSVNELIEEFKDVHGDKYDYSKINYTSNKNKINIICEKHGEFKQLPANHKNGQGCPKCAGIHLSMSELINDYKSVHGERYDYSKVVYKGSNKKIIVICKKHGEFTLTSNAHKNGGGCPKCVGRNLTNNDIIQQFKDVHGDKYDYSKINYKGVTKKVVIVCKKHGEFEQSPAKHKNGQGCPKCIGLYASSQDIIQQFKEIHGDVYDYSKVNYNGVAEKVVIVCKKHGEFKQLPSNHKSGQGCPKCKKRRR